VINLECCSNLEQIDIDPDKNKIVLVGNPNVGKSIFLVLLAFSWSKIGLITRKTLFNL
jgi:GTP1/Obg family GTP-binding protein